MNIKSYIILKYHYLYNRTKHLIDKYSFSPKVKEYIWVYHPKEWGLGNFINLTPTLKSLSVCLGDKVPVYFDNKWVAECFINCPFIKILAFKPPDKPLFTSAWVCHSNNMPDYIFVYKQIQKVFNLKDNIPHTYIDIPSIEVNKKKVVFIRGSASEDKDYLDMKMPSDKYYKEYISKYNYNEMIFVGTESDLIRSKDLFKDMDKCINNIRKVLAIISEAELVIANDSGLAHAAAAMNKHLILLWKNSPIPRVANPGLNSLYKTCY